MTYIDASVTYFTYSNSGELYIHTAVKLAKINRANNNSQQLGLMLRAALLDI